MVAGEEDMRSAKELLAGLTDLCPPGEGQRHAIGINEAGKLEIVLFLGERYQPVTADDEDLDKSVEQLLVEIGAVLPAWCKSPDLVACKSGDG